MGKCTQGKGQGCERIVHGGAGEDLIYTVVVRADFLKGVTFLKGEEELARWNAGEMAFQQQ